MLCIVLIFYAFFGLPVMTKIERKKIKDILLGFDSPKIFEYGSGYSTVYFPRFLINSRKGFTYTSVENNARWNQKVLKLINKYDLNKSVKINFISDEDTYANFPSTLTYKFDLIIIDGRFRNKCMEVAKNCLSDKGSIFLHDAEREKYIKLPSGRIFDSGKYYPLQRSEHKYWISTS